MSIKTVVELDLVGYSDVARALEENLDSEVVARFDAQIQEFVDAGLKFTGVERAQVLLRATGDGAILAFDSSADAHRFAVEVHRATQKYNVTRSPASSRRWFRIGMATGDLYRGPNGAGQDLAGTVIANAVRLEAAARPGEIITDATTFASLPAEFQILYGPEELVRGKRDERFPARRCVVVQYAAALERASHSPRLLTRRTSLATGAAAVVVAAVTWRLERDAINGLLHPLPRPRRVAVLPEGDLHASTEDGSLLNGILESVCIQLARSEKLESDLFFIPPRALRGQKVSSVSQALGLFGANLLLSGSLRRAAESVVLILRLTETSTGKLLRRAEIATPLAAFYALASLTVRRAAALLDISRNHWSLQATTGDTVNPDAYTAYERGRGLLRGYGLPVTDQAIAELQKAVEFDPHFARAWASLSDAYSARFHLTKDAAALELADRTSAKAMELTPDLSAACSGRARVELYQGLYDAAIDHARKATRLDPDNGDAQISLAEIYLRSGKFGLAEQTYQQLSNNRPNDWLALNDWGDFCFDQANYARAERLFREATVLAPQAALPWRNLGAVYLATGQLNDADRALSRSVELLPSGEAFTNLGTALFWLRKYRQAADAYLKAVKLNPQHPLLWRNLGDAYQMIGGMNNKAMAAWRKAADLTGGLLDVNPNNVDALVSLALYRAKLGEIVPALALLRRVDTLPGRTVEQLFYEAQAYELAGKRDSALQLIKDCLRLGYSSADILHAPELANLREDPRFRDLGQKAAAR